MRLSQSVVLWQGSGGIQKIALSVKDQVHIMPRKAQISKEKWQSIITLRHEGQSIRKIVKVQSQKPSSAMMKLALMRTATGKEAPELPLQQRISYLELTAPQIAAQINASQSSSNRHIWTSTVQKRLRESGHGRIAEKKPLLKDTNNKKRLAWANKHEQWTLDRWKSVLWSKFAIFGSNRCVFVRRRVVNGWSPHVRFQPWSMEEVM